MESQLTETASITNPRYVSILSMRFQVRTTAGSAEGNALCLYMPFSYTGTLAILHVHSCTVSRQNFQLSKANGAADDQTRYL